MVGTHRRLHGRRKKGSVGYQPAAKELPRLLNARQAAYRELNLTPNARVKLKATEIGLPTLVAMVLQADDGSDQAGRKRLKVGHPVAPTAQAVRL
jgi:hypothetical protein